MNQGKAHPLALGVLVLGVFVLIVAVYQATRGGVETPGAFRDDVGVREAVSLASDDGRLVVAVATASYCGPCRAYKRSALSDERVASWLGDRAVAVLVDVQERPEDAQRLGVRSIPATYVLRDGVAVASTVGALGAGDLLAWLDSAAAMP